MVVTIPTVHINGTSKKALLEQISKANHALIVAIDALVEMSPNGRDYYLTDNFKVASAEHRARIAKIFEVKSEIMAIGEAIADQEE